MGTVELKQVDIAEVMKSPKRKRRSLLEQATVGDLVVALAVVEIDAQRTKTGTHTETKAELVAIEMVLDGRSGDEIVERWKDQGVVVDALVEVWEARPGGYYRKRRAGR